jgi:hypothetical protein
LGFPTGWSFTTHQALFLAPLPGIEEEEEEEAPSSTRHQLFFWRRCREGSRRLLRGEFSHTHPLLCFKFCFTLFIFICIILSKTQKILVPTIVVIFVGLLLACFIMLSINGWFL